MNVTKAFRLMLVTAVCGIVPIAAAWGADLSAYRWTHRLLFIFAASTADANYGVLNERITQAAMEIEDRDMIIFRIFEKSPSWVASKPLSQNKVTSLRRRFGIDSDPFSVVLVGKDGGVKMSKQGDVDLQSIFNLIDSMPMRQQEMRKNSTR